MVYGTSHVFAEFDARYASVLIDLRRAVHEAKVTRWLRKQARQAIREVESHRGFSGCTPSIGDLPWVSRFGLKEPRKGARTALDLFVQSKFDLNRIAGALDAARHIHEDCRTVRHLLEQHAAELGRIAKRSAVLIWLMARTAWRKLPAKVPTRFTIRRATGFFGAEKVDGRNTP